MSPLSSLRLVNVGCGRTHHPAWFNLDLVASSPEVTECDLTKGIPFAEDSCDAVYSSHVLEHLPAKTGASMLRDCWRVLKPGGIVRIAVPDLERITREYLSALEAAAATGHLFQHRWMQLEMYDQVSRTTSGGEMGAVILGAGPDELRFIMERIGQEAALLREPKSGLIVRSPQRTARRAMKRLHRLLLEGIVRLFGGRRAHHALREGFFRQSGEIHVQMYDRVSLALALAQAGFMRIEQKRAGQSDIPDFASHELEIFEGCERKPDSLYMEALKPS